MKIANEVKQILKSVFFDNPEYEIECAQKLKNAAEIMSDESDKETIKLLGSIMALWDNGESENPYTASSIVIRGSRSINYNDLTENDFDNLEKLMFDIEPPFLLARIADILWIHKKERSYAEMAVSAYKVYFEILYDKASQSRPLKLIKRAYKIAFEIAKNNKKDTIYVELCQYINSLIEQPNEAENVSPISLIELILPSASREYIVKYIEVVDTLIAKNTSVNADIYYDLKIKLVKELGDNSALICVYSSYAKAVEDFASTLDGRFQYDAIAQYEKAVSLYRKAKKSDDADRILKILEPLKRAQYENMATIPIEIDISKEVALIKSLIEGLNIQEQLICLCKLTTFDKIEDVEKSVIEKNSGQFIHTMFGKNILDRDGKTILSVKPLDIQSPKVDDKQWWLHMHLEAFERQRFGAFVTDLILHIICKENPSLETSDLDFLVKNNFLIPDDRKHIFKLGLYYGLKGDFYTALHLLAPQVENLFRELAKLCGGLVTDFNDDGSEQVKGLTSIVKIPELIDCYDANVLFIFEGLLNRVAGANIRNKIGHGIMDSDEGNSQTSKFFFAAVVKWLSWYSPDCYPIYTSIKDDFNSATMDFKCSGNEEPKCNI